MAQTDGHTDRHCDLETESAQWADAVKIDKINQRKNITLVLISARTGCGYNDNYMYEAFDNVRPRQSGI